MFGQVITIHPQSYLFFYMIVSYLVYENHQNTKVIVVLLFYYTKETNSTFDSRSLGSLRYKQRETTRIRGTLAMPSSRSDCQRRDSSFRPAPLRQDRLGQRFQFKDRARQDPASSACTVPPRPDPHGAVADCPAKSAGNFTITGAGHCT